MTLKDRVFSIKAKDETKEAVESVEGGLSRMRQGFSNLRVGAAAAAAAIASALSVAAEQFNKIEDRMRSLNRAVYDFSEAQKQAQGNLLSLGAEQTSANNALAALAGGSQQLGLEQTDEQALVALTAIEELGGDAFIARDLGRQFGLSGQGFTQQTRTTAAIAGSRGIQDFSQFQRYLSRGAPALQSLGLNLEQGAEFFADILGESSGVNAEQNISGINQFIRMVTAAGLDPRAQLQRQIQIAQQTGNVEPGLFGEAQLSISQAFSSGNVGLGNQLGLSYLNNIASPESVAFQYNTAARAQGQADALLTHSNPFVRTVASVYGAAQGGASELAGALPLVGDLAQNVVDITSPEAIQGAANFVSGNTQRRETLQVTMDMHKVYNTNEVGEANETYTPTETRYNDVPFERFNNEFR